MLFPLVPFDQLTLDPEELSVAVAPLHKSWLYPGVTVGAAGTLPVVIVTVLLLEELPQEFCSHA